MTIITGILIGFVAFAVIFMIELKSEIKIRKYMAKTDFTYCRGIHCPNRNQCKRYVIGLEAANDGNSNHSWIQSCRHAKLFIHKDGSEEVEI